MWNAHTLQPYDAGMETANASPACADDDDDKRSTAGTSSRRRTARACEGCRKKKIACNGKQPCTACSMRGRDCVYTALTVTGRPSKGAVRLLQRQIERLESELAQARKASADDPPNSSDPRAYTFENAGKAIRPEAGRTDSEESQSKYNSTGLDAAVGRSTKLDEEFMFIERTFTDSVNLSDAVTDENYRRQMDLHTSFRLERYTDGDYLADSGWFVSVFRLEQSLAGAQTGEQPKEKLRCKRQWLDERPEMQCPLVDEHPEIHLPSQVKLHWPSREREDQMINVYFRLVHPMLPILCKETLTAQRKGPLRPTLEGDSIWLSIMLGIFIAAARYMPIEYVNIRRWWTARSYLDSHHFAQGRSVGGVQNYLLSIAIRTCLFVDMQQDWATVGVALRAMQDRGFHRECVLTTRFPDERYAGIIRCMWWTAQRIEVDICAWSGRRPTAISFDVLPPRSHALASPVPYFNASLKGLPMLARVMDREYMVNSNLRAIVLRDVHAWLAELLEYFAFMPAEKDDEKFMASSKLWMFVNMTVAYSYRPAILILSRKLRTHAGLNSGTAWKPEASDEECMREFADAQKHIKEALKRTVVVLRSLIQRGTAEINFVDDEIMGNLGGATVHGCLLHFGESMLEDAPLDGTVLQCLEETNSLLGQSRYPGALLGRAAAFLMSMTRQVKAHITNLEEQRNAKGKAKRRHCESGCAATGGSTSSAAPRSTSCPTTFASTSSFIKPDETSPSTFQCLCTSGVCQEAGAGHDGLQIDATTANFDAQNWYTSQLGAPPTVQYAPLQAQDGPSCETEFWNDLLRHELMVLDDYDTAGFSRRMQVPAAMQSATLPHQRAAHDHAATEQNAMAGMLPAALQVPSFWLGPTLDQNLSPPTAS